MKVIYIGFTFPHHIGTHAGYNQIKNFLNYDRVIDCQKEYTWLNYPVKSFLGRLIRKVYYIFLGRGCTLTILYCIFLSLTRKNQVFHFIYAENTYKWLHFFKGDTNKIVCTYHQPIKELEKNCNWIKDLSSVDKVIILSNKNQNWFEGITKIANVKYLPHGINTDFYSPLQNKRSNNNILMVGNWLRDFEFANEIFEQLINKNEQLTITVVTDKINYKYFSNNNRINLQSGISDDELLDLYRKAKFLFLPLFSFTANNAILEAAASGCPIIIATNNIDYSYFDDRQLHFLPLQKDVVLEFIDSFLKTDYNEIEAMAIRNFVIENYSWEVVAKKTKYFLEN